MRKMLGGLASFVFGNACSWYVFWASGEAMFTVYSGLAAAFGVLLGAVFAAAAVHE